MADDNAGTAGGYENFRHAPITEAVIDFRVDQQSHSDLVPALEQLAKSQADQYPRLLTQYLFEGHLRFDEEGVLAAGEKSDVIGYQIRDEDDLYVAAFQVGGLVVSRLRPYESWERLYAEAWRLWQLYLEAVRPEAVTRLATRFLNHIPLPISYETGDYFKVPIHVPDGLPYGLVAYHYRYVMDVGDGVRANVTLSSEPVEQGAENATTLFDIDCYRQEGSLPDDPKIPDVLGNLREIKNRIFFESLTDKTLELFR